MPVVTERAARYSGIFDSSSDTVQIRFALTEPHGPVAWRYVEAARALLRAACDQGAGPLEVRLALQSLQRALAARDSAAPPTLTIVDDASTVHLPSGQCIDLHRYRALRLLVLALAHERLERPGQALGPDALIEHGWPGERVLPTSGRLRVRVGVSKLRQLGLRDFLVSRIDGYLIRADVSVVLEDRSRTR